MPDATPADGDEAPRDDIAWKRILIGYAMVLIMLTIVAVAHAGLFPDSRDARGPLALVVVAVTIPSMLLARPMAAMHRTLLASRPRLDDALQWAAIGMLLVLSAATIVAGLLTLEPNGGV